MKLRIIKEFNISDTKALAPGSEIEVTNEKAAQMIKEGFAEDIKPEVVKRKVVEVKELKGKESK